MRSWPVKRNGLFGVLSAEGMIARQYEPLQRSSYNLRINGQGGATLTCRYSIGHVCTENQQGRGRQAPT